MNINLANIDFCPGGKSATLTETTAEILLSETEKVIVPPEGTDGFNKVTITHAPVEESVSATITENGTHTITPSEGFGAMVGVNVDVNVTTPVEVFTDLDGMKYTGSIINEFPSNFQFAPRTGENCKSIFDSCSSLTTIPQLNTSNVTSMYSMFANCSSLTSIPQLDTRSVTNMYNIFNGCSSLTTIPQLDTSNVTVMNNMFAFCSSLVTIPQMDTSKVTTMNQMFAYDRSLTSVPKLDATNLTSASGMFRVSYGYDNFTTFGGLTNLKINLDLSDCPALTKESLLNVFNEAADVTADPKTLTLGSKNLAKLTDEDKAIATNKGWTLA